MPLAPQPALQLASQLASPLAAPFAAQFAAPLLVANHEDPVVPVALGLACILAAAWLGGRLATRFGQPAVLGELIAGLLLGNLPLGPVGPFLASDPVLQGLSGLGVIVLLFGVGLESTVAGLRQVGVTALLVACIGVVVPFGLGWGVALWLLPGQSLYAHAFIGAALCATSVGITARVLKDLGRLHLQEAQIILGAAVIDDVLGLLVLSVVSGLIAAADAGIGFSGLQVLLVVAKAAGFLGGAVLLGRFGTPQLFSMIARFQLQSTRLSLLLALCLVFSWAASALGLAPIVGAFAAGLVLEDGHAQAFELEGKADFGRLIEPVGQVLVPIFFVLMGVRTDLQAFVQPGVPALAAGLTLAAVIGKQACGLVAVGRGPSGAPLDRLTIGLGMIPRGEVGLIFAAIGSGMTIGGEKVVGPSTFSALVVMVIVTTMMTPPLLRWSLGRRRRASSR